MAKTDPALIGSEVRHGNASEMRANSGADENLGVAGIGEGGLGFLVEEGGAGGGGGLVDLGDGQSSDEDELAVPGGLHYFARGDVRDVYFFVGVPNIPDSGDHLLVEAGGEGLDSEHVAGEHERLVHVHLRPLDLVVSVLLVPQSVLVKPVVVLSSSVKWITEV
mmetsp:Transcript_10811/g.9534  ORF Transcript_10811/g.9534 Transcript_10811/m.9534 type:complete len:164 (+) Transcript_10811:182-673(+)